jgi:hypothetical protein
MFDRLSADRGAAIRFEQENNNCSIIMSNFKNCSATANYHSFFFISTNSIVAACNLVIDSRKTLQTAGGASFYFYGSRTSTIGAVNEMNSTNNHLATNAYECAFYCQSFANFQMTVSNLFNDSGYAYAVYFNNCAVATCNLTNIAAINQTNTCICYAVTNTPLIFNKCCFKESGIVALFYPYSGSITANGCYIKHSPYSIATGQQVATNNRAAPDLNLPSRHCISKPFSKDFFEFDPFIQSILCAFMK